VKKTWIWLTIMVSVLLCACGETAEPGENGTRAVVMDNVTYFVDEAAGTIRQGEIVYEYSLQSFSDGRYRVSFHYPDGNSYWWEQGESFGSGGWSDGYFDLNPDYADGDVLREVLLGNKTVKSRDSNVNPLLVLLLLGLGLWGTLSPQSMWYLEYGWRFRDAEPSDAALAVNRITGVLCLLIGIILLIGLIF